MIGEWERAGEGLRESRGVIMSARIKQRVVAGIDSNRDCRLTPEFRRAVAGSASDIENAFPGGEARGEMISRDVLGPEIVIDFAGDDTLAREFAHAVFTPIREFTSTRQGKWKWP